MVSWKVTGKLSNTAARKLQRLVRSSVVWKMLIIVSQYPIRDCKTDYSRKKIDYLNQFVRLLQIQQYHSLLDPVVQSYQYIVYNTRKANVCTESPAIWNSLALKWATVVQEVEHAVYYPKHWSFKFRSIRKFCFHGQDTSPTMITVYWVVVRGAVWQRLAVILLSVCGREAEATK